MEYVNEGDDFRLVGAQSYTPVFFNTDVCELPLPRQYQATIWLIPLIETCRWTIDLALLALG